MTAVLSVLGGTVMLALTGWILRNRLRVDPALAAWRRFTARLARRGVAWQAWEGPQAFAERAARQAPLHAERIRKIAALYSRLRYGAAPRPSDLIRLKAEIAEVTMRPENTIELNGDDAVRMQRLLDVLEDLDDVQDVFHNAEIPE